MTTTRVTTRKGAGGATFRRAHDGAYYGAGGDLPTGEHVLTWPAQGGGWWAGRQRWTWTPGEAEPVEEKARGAIFPTLAAVLAGWVELEAVTA